MRHVPRNKSELIDLHAVLLLESPYYLEEDIKLIRHELKEMGDVFEAFRSGIGIVYKGDQNSEFVRNLNNILDEIYNLYYSGKVIEGQERTLDLEKEIHNYHNK